MKPLRVPAPERDLANFPPYPQDTADGVDSTEATALGMLTIVLGSAVLLFAMLAALLQIGPFANSSNFVLTESLRAGAGLCFILCGVAFLRKGLLAPLVLLILGAILGFFDHGCHITAVVLGTEGHFA